MEKIKILISSAPDDFYLGDPLARYLNENECEAVLNIVANSAPTPINMGEFSKFVFITNPQAVEDASMHSLMESALGHKNSEVYFLQNGKVNAYNLPSGKALVINVEGGIDTSDADAVTAPFQSVNKGTVIDFDDLARKAKEKEIVFEREIDTLDEEMLIVDVDMSASTARGVKYMTGDGVPKDRTRALALFRKAVQEAPDDSIAKYYLAICGSFCSAKEKAISRKEATALLEQALEAGLKEALMPLATIYFDSDKSEDKAKAKAIYEDMARNGIARGVFMMGYYAELEGRYEDAFDYYSDLAESGYSRAQNGIGCLYADGLLGEVDFGRARQWFEMAAQDNLPRAISNLGLVMINTAANSQQTEEALELIRKACEYDVKSAKNILAKHEKMMRELHRKQEQEGKKQEVLESLSRNIRNGSLLGFIGEQIKTQIIDRAINGSNSIIGR